MTEYKLTFCVKQKNGHYFHTEHCNLICALELVSVTA